MLVKPPLEKLLPRVENRYTLAIAIAKRTRQLVAGAQPMAESDSPSLVTMACEELAAGTVVAVPDIVEPYINLRPDVEAALQNEREQAEANDDMSTADVFAADEQSMDGEDDNPIEATATRHSETADSATNNHDDTEFSDDEQEDLPENKKGQNDGAENDTTEDETED
ncbi:DNA-directed RNA polymerase, omega subunit [Mageeibacillus indolicus UPII9-5]|uniref:DNA-directed RNA polymerase subunit omega n=1 Tax=Mageeibacillus indolicus (strain UPII9-5) TaxID=699246 RepID=D3QZ47_MAGIU|nr:DNA-directed RNA polymerase subunit omega [Mageeibacillus indolicus]ADC91796.1 DNA-directed RNA polymerase, omega subunit [Mageeibacillus indolicus UPII9-5]